MSKPLTVQAGGYEQRIGDHRAICAWSGFMGWASEMVQQWDGQYVLKRFCDERNPQDFLKGVADNQSVPWTRPDTDPVFIETPVTAADL